jgi:hypothetical protein
MKIETRIIEETDKKTVIEIYCDGKLIHRQVGSAEQALAIRERVCK